MKSKIFFTLIAFSLFITSCTNREDDEQIINQTNYTFTFIDYEEPIDVVQLEILDSNNNIIKTETFYNIQKNVTLSYSFNQGSKLTIKVSDDTFFHAFYTIKKNDVKIYDNWVINGNLYTQVTKQL